MIMACNVILHGPGSKKREADPNHSGTTPFSKDPLPDYPEDSRTLETALQVLRDLQGVADPMLVDQGHPDFQELFVQLFGLAQV